MHVLNTLYVKKLRKCAKDTTDYSKGELNMWIDLNNDVQLPKKGHDLPLRITDRGEVCQGAKIVGSLVDGEENQKNHVSVRWHDGYLEEFDATEVRFGSDLLWLRLCDGQNRHIPLRSVRWFGMSHESHATISDNTED